MRIIILALSACLAFASSADGRTQQPAAQPSAAAAAQPTPEPNGLQELLDDVRKIVQDVANRPGLPTGVQAELTRLLARLAVFDIGSLWDVAVGIDVLVASGSVPSDHLAAFTEAANLIAVAFATAALDAPTDTETNRPHLIPFLEGTDVFWTIQSGGNGKLVFPNKLEADIFPHLVLSQNYTDVIDITAQQERGPRRLREFAYSISGTPAVRIRMLRETSAPVRTPSYMPRVNVQLLWARGLKDMLTAADRQADLPDSSVRRAKVFEALARLPRVSLWEWHLIVGHHSNGQDGCLSNEQERNPPETGDCLPAGVIPTAATINRINGSFSTNYIRTGINYSRNWMTATRELHAIREWRVRGEFEYHPKPWVDDDMVDIYGRARLNVGTAYAARTVRPCRKRLEGSAGLTWNPGVVETDPPLSLSFASQVSCFPWENGGWGFFVRFYRGQDYYNVGFLDRITRVHIGTTFNQSGFFRFRRPTPR